MSFEYIKQIKAFLHFLFKHLFEGEFAIRVCVEIFLFLCIIYALPGIFHKIICKSRACIGFINWKLVVPLCIRLFDKLAFLIKNSNLQNIANRIKDAYQEKKDVYKEKKDKYRKKKKSYEGWCFLIYLVLVTWIIGFHYYDEKKRSNYGVFFLGEEAILGMEELLVDTVLNTDEYVIECFFHDRIEGD